MLDYAEFEHQHHTAVDVQVEKVLTLKNRLVRLMNQDPTEMQVKQGALEYNAYLIKNLIKDEVPELTKDQKRTALTMLHLNLSKLADDADTFQMQTNERHRLLSKLDRLDTTDSKELTHILEES